MLFDDQYLDLAGQICVIIFGLVDSGDGDMQREIFDWHQAHPPYRPSKSFQNREQPYNQTKVDTHPGLFCFNFHTTYYKDDLLDGNLRINPGDAGAWHLHSNWPDGKFPDNSKATGLLTDYACQLCSESKNELGLWKNPRKKAKHYLDCEVLQLVWADSLGLCYMSKDQETEAPASPGRDEESQSLTRSHSRW